MPEMDDNIVWHIDYVCVQVLCRFHIRLIWKIINEKISLTITQIIEELNSCVYNARRAQFIARTTKWYKHKIAFAVLFVQEHRDSEL